jgi:hypothetical protein
VLSGGGGEAISQASSLAEPLDEVAPRASQLLAGQSELAERYAALAGTMHPVEREKNQLRVTLAFGLLRRRANCPIDPAVWAPRPMICATRPMT